MSSAQQQFVSTYLPLAQQVAGRTGLPASFVLGQAAWETGWGSSPAATSGNNFFGLSPGGSVASYASPAAGFGAYADLINGRYAGVAGSTSDPFGLASGLVSAGYNTADPGYASGVAATTRQVTQLLAGGAGAGAAAPGGGLSGLLGGSWLPTWLQPAPGTYNPNGSLNLAPGAGNPLNAAGLNPSSWIGELVTRGMLLMLAGVLVLSGIFLAGASRHADVLATARNKGLMT